MGSLSKLKNSQKWKFFKSNFNVRHFKLAFHLMNSVRIFSYDICKTHCTMSQSLNDMHASLPDLKYRPPFLLNLLVAWLVRSCYLIWVIFVVWLSSPLELAHISLFPDLFAQLSLCGAHCDPLACERFSDLSNNLRGLFITLRLIAKNIRCHLLKGSSCLL